MKIQSFVLWLLLFGIFHSHSYVVDDDDNMVSHNNGENNVINVGLIVDMESWVGKVIQSSITMALSEFYNLNNGCSTRIALHVRDSFNCTDAALDLLENVEVHAIVIQKIPNGDLFLPRLGDRVNVPVLSFSSISNEHPCFIQFAEDEKNQFHGIAAFLEEFKWRSFVFLYEDTADARQAQTYVHDLLQDYKLAIAYQAAVSIEATDDQISNELHKFNMMKASTILVHLSPSLATKVFVNAKKLGMMSNGFVWILTSKTTNSLEYSMDDSSVYESMQGVVGFRPYIPISSKIQNLTLRWRREFQPHESNAEMKELNVYGVFAYDAAWVLAEAVERVSARLKSNSGSAILSKITNSNSTGLLGTFKIENRKLVLDTYEIVNVLGKGERRVGFWSSAYGLTKEISNSSSGILETIIWPGFDSTAPKKRWLLQKSGKSFRVGIPTNGRFPELVSLHHDPKNNETILSGFCIEVFRAAVDRLPYKVSFEYIPFDNLYGSYNDLVHEVFLQNFDAAVGDITVVSNRSEYVDFTLPYTELGVGVVVRLNKDSWFFLKPLKADLWITTGCFFILIGFVVWLIEHRINEEFQGPPARQIGTAMGFAASTLVYAHREKLQSNVSKFVVGVWLFVVLILTSCYIAKLTSVLTVEQIKLSKSDYIGYSGSSFIQGITVSNLNFNDNRLKPYRSPEEYDEALRKGSKNGGVSAIAEELPYLKIFIARFPRDYIILESSLTSNGFGFAFPKGSPLVHDMSKAIAELREEGKLVQLEKKWFSSRSELLYQDDESILDKADPLGMDNFFGLFYISGVSIIIAVFVFLVFLIREKMSIYYYVFTMLAKGKLMSILMYFYPRMVDIIGTVNNSE
ncbi:hypothetical protein ABFX02_04G073800 [Erythranthe guttata]